MKLGLISDVHANLEALETALEFFEKKEIDEIFCCGDLVGYGPEPGKVIEKLKARGAFSVRGNHDHLATKKRPPSNFNPKAASAIEWTKEKLTSSQKSFLEDLNKFEKPKNSDIKASHGAFSDPLWGYVIRPSDAYLEFQKDEERPRYRLMGHSHLPVLFTYDGEDVSRHRPNENESFTFKKGERYIINPGSIGQPRDGNWKSSLAVMEFENGEPHKVSFYRLSYPVEKTREKILEAGLPKELGDRLLSGR